jgi:hypothetical protein
MNDPILALIDEKLALFDAAASVGITDEMSAEVLSAAIEAAKRGDREAAAKLAALRHMPGMAELLDAVAAEQAPADGPPMREPPPPGAG